MLYMAIDLLTELRRCREVATNLLGFGAFQDCTEPHGVKAVRAAASLRYSRRTTSPPLDPLLSLRALPHP